MINDIEERIFAVVGRVEIFIFHYMERISCRKRVVHCDARKKEDFGLVLRRRGFGRCRDFGIGEDRLGERGAAGPFGL
jgi:hypothetical protein